MADKRTPQTKRLSNGRTSARSPSSSPSEVSDPFAAGYDILLVNGSIDDKLFGPIIREITHRRANSKLVLCLVTYGGTANAAYRIGRFLQNVYDEVVAFVPSTCKSAGTLIITAAHKLVMSDFGEIGPLDVQLMPRDEIAGNRSGLVTKSALDELSTQTFNMFEKFVLGIVQASSTAVSFRLAAEVAASVSAQCMSNIFEKINPDSLGQDLRDLNVATEYATRLSQKGCNLTADAIRKLVHDYPSHDFVIDLEEARDLFIHIDRPSPTLNRRILEHMSDMMIPQTRGLVVRMLTATGPSTTATDAASSSPSSGDAGHDPQDQERDGRTEDRGVQTPRGTT